MLIKLPDIYLIPEKLKFASLILLTVLSLTSLIIFYSNVIYTCINPTQFNIDIPKTNFAIIYLSKVV